MSQPKITRKNFGLIAAVVIFVAIIATFASSTFTKKTDINSERIVKKLTIKELGIEIGLSETLRNLKYEAQDKPLGPGSPSRQIAVLSLKEYTDLANKCTGLKGDPHIIKTLVKVNGQAGKNTGSTMLKQLKDYYIVSLESGLPANEQCKKSKLRPQLETLYKKINTQLNNSVRSSKIL